MIEKEIVQVEEVILELRLPIQVNNCKVEGRLSQYLLLILTRLIRYLLYAPRYGKIRICQQCLIMKFGLPKGLAFGQKAEISLEGNFKLGNLMILPKKINLLLVIRELIFLILLKFLRTETLVIFSSITSDHFIFNISKPKIHNPRGGGLKEHPFRLGI